MSDVVLTEAQGRVLLITLNRPDAMNAINSELADGVLAAVEQLGGDDGLSAGVLTGAGRGFCAGMDLKAFAKDGLPTGFMPFIQSGSQKPLIAAVEGFALAGGLEIVLSCDLIVAARGVKLGIPEVTVGLFAAAGGLLRLPSRLPYAVAMELALTGDPITAEQARSSSARHRASPSPSSGSCRSPSSPASSAPRMPRKVPGPSPRSGRPSGAVGNGRLARRVTP